MPLLARPTALPASPTDAEGGAYAERPRAARRSRKRGRFRDVVQSVLVRTSPEQAREWARRGLARRARRPTPKAGEVRPADESRRVLVFGLGVPVESDPRGNLKKTRAAARPRERRLNLDDGEGHLYAPSSPIRSRGFPAGNLRRRAREELAQGEISPNAGRTYTHVAASPGLGRAFEAEGGKAGPSTGACGSRGPLPLPSEARVGPRGYGRAHSYLRRPAY